MFIFTRVNLRPGRVQARRLTLPSVCTNVAETNQRHTSVTITIPNAIMNIVLGLLDRSIVDNNGLFQDGLVAFVNNIASIIIRSFGFQTHTVKAVNLEIGSVGKRRTRGIVPCARVRLFTLPIVIVVRIIDGVRQFVPVTTTVCFQKVYGFSVRVRLFLNKFGLRGSKIFGIIRVHGVLDCFIVHVAHHEKWRRLFGIFRTKRVGCCFVRFAGSIPAHVGPDIPN
mmetsp:Transcript_16227/g.32588  ORF Transcript_16227/g.32588 Transcript_16227/m.32588 type:complete len:225 (-) Transcript_16227:1454-2128(-)